MSRAAGVKSGARPQVLLPEPDLLWIRYAPRSWPCAPSGGGRGSGAPPLWLDLAGDRLGAAGEPGRDEIELPTGPFDDVLYLSPVAAHLRTPCNRAAAEVAAQGTPVLVQLLPGESPPHAEGVVPVYDLLEPLVAGDLAVLGDLPAGSAAVWPLVAGLTDSADLRDEGVRRLAEAGVAVLQAVSPDLPPADRRRLFESQSGAGGHAGEEPAEPAHEDENLDPIAEQQLGSNRSREEMEVGEDEGELFRRLFHGGLPNPRPLARAAQAVGLAPFLRRPLPRPPLSGAANREIAGLLALAGEIHVRLGRLAPSQACFRAARWIDQTGHDLQALAREGNLHILPWLEPICRPIVEEWAETGGSNTVRQYVEGYVT